MKAMTRILTLVVAVAMVAPAMADWNVGDPYKMHSPQLPDLDNGMNVQAWYPNILADDFLCTETGPITGIHIWGSWLDDQYPSLPGWDPSPLSVDFRLSIYSDIPASQSPTGYSMPGEMLWTAMALPLIRFWAESDEEFYDPNLDEIMGTDTQVWQYNFSYFGVPGDEEKPFVQERDTTYWLSVTAFPYSHDAVFGWKTSDKHWNDDAVFWEDIFGTEMSPQELRDPRFDPPRPSLDLAFVITPEPASLALLGAGSIVALLKRRRRRG